MQQYFVSLMKGLDNSQMPHCADQTSDVYLHKSTMPDMHEALPQNMKNLVFQAIFD